MEQLIIHIDHYHYQLWFDGFSRALQVIFLSESTEKTDSVLQDELKKIEILPWTLKQHMAALRESFYWEDNQAKLDSQNYALKVLGKQPYDQSELKDFIPIALWWASGNYDNKWDEEKILSEQTERWVFLNQEKNIAVKLKSWTMLECIHALDKALQLKDGLPKAFDVINYLEDMLKTSVIAMQPEDLIIDSLDAGAAKKLLKSVLALNCVNIDKETDKKDLDQMMDLEQKVAVSSPYTQQLLHRMAQNLHMDLYSMLHLPSKNIEQKIHIVQPENKLSSSSMVDSSNIFNNFATSSPLARYDDSVVINIG